jgi:hypothetical protein
MENLQFYFNLISIFVLSIAFVRWSDTKTSDALFKAIMFCLCIVGSILLVTKFITKT